MSKRYIIVRGNISDRYMEKRTQISAVAFEIKGYPLASKKRTQISALAF